MIATDESSPLRDLPPSAHACWVVDDDAAYISHARSFLQRGKDAARKPLAFGSYDSPLVVLKPVAEVSLHPRLSRLDSGLVRTDRMLTAFREHAALAHAEGFEGICVVVDMDWLIPATPTTDDVVGFELLLDQVVSKLDATVVCAYRRSSFDVNAIVGAQSVHPVDLGVDAPPLFRLVAGDGELWRLTGEIDLAVTTHLGAALTAVTAQGRCDIDVTGLEFIDVRGMATLADAARRSHTPMRLLGASGVLRRNWQLAGFDECAPMVELVA